MTREAIQKQRREGRERERESANLSTKEE